MDENLDAPKAVVPSKEHVNLVAMQVASGETSSFRIAANLELTEPYVEVLRGMPEFALAFERVSPTAIPVSRPFDLRLADAKQDALTVASRLMRTATHERTKLAAAKVILDADKRQTGIGGPHGFGSGGFVLPPGEADRIVETRIQTRTYAVGNGNGGPDGGSPPPTSEGQQRQSVLPSPGSPSLQGPSTTRTSPCMSVPVELANP